MSRTAKKIILLVFVFNLYSGAILFGGDKPALLNAPSLFQKDFRLSVYHAVEYAVQFEKTILEICGKGAPAPSKIKQDRTHNFIDSAGKPFSLHLLYSKSKKGEDGRIKLTIVLSGQEEGTGYEKKLTAYIDPETYILARIDDEKGGLFYERSEHSFGDVLESEKNIFAQKIPPKTILYVTKTTERYMKAIYKDLLRKKNVLLVGERGTGKDSMILELCHRLKYYT